MSEPILSFMYNTSENDVAYTGQGEEAAPWQNIKLQEIADTKIFTGGGINGTISTPTADLGSRDATLRPLTGAYVIPQVFIESTADNVMYNVPLAGRNINRYVFGVYVDGYIASDLYLEMWDTSDFLTTYLPVVSGTNEYQYSMVNAIRTTDIAPPEASWHGTTTSGASCLSGFENRLRLKNADFVHNESVYYNMYLLLPHDSPLFHNQPVESFRYLYV